MTTHTNRQTEAPRYFVLARGTTVEEAIDETESTYTVVSSRFTHGWSLPVYGIAEIERPGEREAE